MGVISKVAAAFDATIIEVVPLPPDILASAMTDRVHTDVGRGRPVELSANVLAAIEARLATEPQRLAMAEAMFRPIPEGELCDPPCDYEATEDSSATETGEL